ncbi:MAG: ABC transporter permease [Bacteroidota bacterium]
MAQLQSFLRSLFKNKITSYINLIGFTVGLAAFILIDNWVVQQQNFDLHHEKAPRIYRATTQFTPILEPSAQSAAPLAPYLLENFPEVEAAGRFKLSWFAVRADGTFPTHEDQVALADPAIFSMFDFSFLEGSASTALSQPNTVVISRTLAQKHFPGGAARGKTIYLDEDPCEVVGVFEDMPQTSHFQFDLLYSMVGDDVGLSPIWLNLNFFTYVLLGEDKSPTELASKFNQAIESKVLTQIDAYLRKDQSDEDKSYQYQVNFQPLASIHLGSQLDGEIRQNGNKTYVYLFSTLSLLILVLVGVNYINTSTADFTLKAEEVGLRKIFGASRPSLIKRFLIESACLSFIGLGLAIPLAFLLGDYLGSWIGIDLSLAGSSTAFFAKIIAYTAGIALLTGIYPAIFLSSFDPIQTLKGKLGRHVNKGRVKNALVAIQFTVSLILTTIAIGTFYQLSYMRSKTMGFDKSQLMVLDYAYEVGDAFDAFRNDLRMLPQVENVSVSGFLPVESNRLSTSFLPLGASSEQEKIKIQTWLVDNHYVDTYGFELNAGQNFLTRSDSIGRQVILNETAAQLLGVDQDAIGNSIEMISGGGTKPFRISGLIRDFHFATLKEKIGPLVLINQVEDSYLTVRLTTSQPDQETLNGIAAAWEEHTYGVPFVYFFLDEYIERQYLPETRLNKLFIIMALLAIIITGIGLFASALFLAQNRRKEVSIRRVLGASSRQVFWFLLKYFAGVFLLACVVAVPISRWFLAQWMEEFSYRISLSPPLFLGAIGMVMVIGFLTICYQLFKSSMTDPAEVLRTE